MIDVIQRSIVEERNNFGDWSVCGDDLALAAAAAVLAFSRASAAQREQILRSANRYRQVLAESCPSIAKAINEEQKT